jgi:redox-sensing transcriptional repressor
MASDKVPDIVISRLPLYLRAITSPLVTKPDITSGELGEMLGISSAQIRKDLSHFGEFGKQGTGYKIVDLVRHLRRILKIEHEWDVALVGAGAIGHALAHYDGFGDRGFRITMIFDNDPEKIGTLISSYTVLDVAQIGELIPQNNISLAMLAVPAESAQGVADRLVQAGVRGILNYAPINLSVPSQVHVQNIDPVENLQRITYYV